MALNGLDVSPWQPTLNLLNVSFDFVLIKATEGTSYVSPTCDTHYQEARRMGKKRAVYMFTDFSDPIAEADFFVNNCRGYLHEAVLVLDWEGSNVGDVQGALTRLRRIRDQAGYNPSIYMSEWVENNYDWSPVVKENFGLIIAKYSNWEIANRAGNYDMSNAGQQPVVKYWPFYWMWQWTSKGLLNGYAGDLDCDIAYVTPEGWDKYAGVLPPTPTTTAPTTTASTTVPPTTAETTTEAPVTTTTEATTTESTTARPVVPVTTATTTDTTQGDTHYSPGKDPEWVTWPQWIGSLLRALIRRLQGK